MKTHLMFDFEREAETQYRGERYRVRDNGAVYRLPRPGQRRRSLDEQWTFGRPSSSSGYMNIASHVVHRIVATAFHGDPPSDKHVVDHIDTNRRNNRPENLRWITRLENLLLNPITLRRIEVGYGSLDEFFEDPQRPREIDSNKSFDWMRTVSKEEAEKSLRRICAWAESGDLPKGGRLGEWVFGAKKISQLEEPRIEELDSLTPIAMQRNWRTPSEFPCCPDVITAEALSDYLERLEFGSVFSRNQYGDSTVVSANVCDRDTCMSVLTHQGAESIKGWAVCKVTVEGERYWHESMTTYFTLQGAIKGHCGLLGIPWDESIDDYC